MKRLFVLVILIVLGNSCFAANRVGKKAEQLADLKDFAKIEKMMPLRGEEEPQNGPSDQYYFLSKAIRADIRSLHKQLSSVSVEKRADILRAHARATKWGSSERFVDYYICAWYGVDYAKTIDYLKHVTFWWEWGIGRDMTDKNGEHFPFSFDDVCVDLLYALYVHNHDFRLLHDVITTPSDAGTAEVIMCLRSDAIRKHPRGVLHVAGISHKGWRLVYDFLHTQTDPNLDLAYTRSKLSPYFKKVAADPTDPLSSLAKDLLKARPKNHRHH